MKFQHPGRRILDLEHYKVSGKLVYFWLTLYVFDKTKIRLAEPFKGVALSWAPLAPGPGMGLGVGMENPPPPISQLWVPTPAEFPLY